MTSGRVIGVGGVFLAVQDMEKVKAWYKDRLGVDMGEYGAHFPVKFDASALETYTVYSFFSDKSTYFAPSEKGFMINFRVDDLDKLAAKLKEKGETLLSDIIDEPYGKFTWIMDPNGIKIELWEQKGPAPEVEGATTH